jgi:hypothetical protein
MENWRPAYGWTGLYEVSDLGRVRNSRTGRVLHQQKHNRGYLHCGLSGAVGVKTVKVHHLVLDTFRRLRRYGEECRHVDGDKTNNALTNLRWGSAKQNSIDRHVHGRTAAGEHHGKSVLLEKDVLSIRKDFRPAADIAKEYGVHPSTVYAVRSRRAWTYLTEEE